MENEKIVGERAVLVGIVTRGESEEELHKSLDELERLLDTAGGVAIARLTQNKETPDPRTLIGSGKVAELAYICACNEATLVVFDCDLAPSQIRNIEDIVGDNVRVIDRSMLILDIFALHAVTGEGKLQVELAQLKYTAPRLIGHGADMSRLGGGIGTRGPGESKLESDRRHMKRRINALEEQIEELEKNRRTMRASRDRSGIPKIAIVGYTNAGKSTLLNALTDAGILAQDKLFATLDPTTRKMELPDGVSILVTDTVGFIRKLPHHLVKAFKSTLDEVRYADILLIVSDAGDPETEEHIAVAREVIADLDASDKPTIYVYNKCDTITDAPYGINGEDRVNVSARTGEGIDGLLTLISEYIMRSKKVCRLLIPYSEQGIVSSLYNSYTVNSVDYLAEGVAVEAILDARALGLYARYIQDEV